MPRLPQCLPPSRLLSALTLLALAACGGKSAPVVPAIDLDVLQVDTSREAPRTDAARVHPLGVPTTTFQKKSELYLSGLTATDAHFTGRFLNQRQVLLDDVSSAVGATPAYAPIFSADASLASWTNLDAASTAADLDGDGLEEVVVLYVNSSLTPDKAFARVIRHADPGVAQQSTEIELGDVSQTRDPNMPQFSNLQLAAGDVDGDGEAEVAAAIGAELLLLDWKGGTFRIAARVAFRPGETLPQVTTVAMGNVDDDPEAEMVVFSGVRDASRTGRFYVYSFTPGGLVLDGGGDSSVVAEADDAASTPGSAYTWAPRNVSWGRVAVGDLDGDGRREIIFAGDVFLNVLSVTLARFDPASRGLTRLTTSRFTMGFAEQMMPVLQVMNADGLEAGPGRELLAYRYILRLGANGRLAHVWGSSEPFAPPLIHGVYWDKVTVGDFTADGRDEVAYVYNTGGLVLVFGLADGTFKEVKRFNVIADGHHTTLTAVNIDQDSTVVKYTGDYELLWSTPQIVAVLTPPPYGAGQSPDAAETVLTFGRDTSDDTGSAVGFYAGLSVGYSAETPFWGSAGSSKVALTVEGSLDWTFTNTSSEGVRKDFTCLGRSNQVVFAATPIDVYQYQIVGGPEAARFGERVSVQVPRTPVLTAMEIDYFNGHVPAEYRVPDDVYLGQVIGNLASYPTRADMLALFADGPVMPDAGRGPYASVIPPIVGGFRTPDPWMATMSVSGDPQRIEVSNGDALGFGSDFNLQVGVEFENVAGGVLVGGKAGFHYGYSHSLTTTNSTIISGLIPGIPAAGAASRGYTTGLFAYPYPSGANPRFMVVNYWVE